MESPPLRDGDGETDLDGLYSVGDVDRPAISVGRDKGYPDAVYRLQWMGISCLARPLRCFQIQHVPQGFTIARQADDFMPASTSSVRPGFGSGGGGS